MTGLPFFLYFIFYIAFFLYLYPKDVKLEPSIGNPYMLVIVVAHADVAFLCFAIGMREQVEHEDPRIVAFLLCSKVGSLASGKLTGHLGQVWLVLSEGWTGGGPAVAEVVHHDLRSFLCTQQEIVNESGYTDLTRNCNQIINCAMLLSLGYILEATTYAESCGGGGSPGSGWGRDKDEDDEHWGRRCIAVSAAMMRPAMAKRKYRSR